MGYRRKLGHDGSKSGARMRTWSTALAALGMLSAPLAALQSESVTIHWLHGTDMSEPFRVPIIEATTTEGAAYGQAWALAMQEYRRVKLNFATTYGYLYEYYPTQVKAKRNDYYIHHLGVPQLAQAKYAAMSADAKAVADAFAQGLNDYYLANTAFEVGLLPGFAPMEQLLLARETQGWEVANVVQSNLIRSQANAQRGLIDEPVPDLDFLFPSVSSDQWAVNGAQSVTGEPMLLVDPHIPLNPGAGADDNINWDTFLCGLFSDEIRSVGYSVLGDPLHSIGVSFPDPMSTGDDILAWSFTTSGLDAADTYYFEVTESSGDFTYAFGALTKVLEEKTITIKKGAWDVVMGELVHLTTDESEVFYESVHGPVFTPTDLPAGEPFTPEDRETLYAFRTPFKLTSDSGANLEQSLALLEARDLDELMDAFDFRAYPPQNVMMASNDASGGGDEIRYLLSGPCPDRSASPLADTEWGGLIDGTVRNNLWTSLHDVATEHPWIGDVAASQDYFINNNSGIATTWGGFDGPSAPTFPFYMTYELDIGSFRQWRADDLIAPSSLSLADMWAIALDDRVNSAPPIIALLEDAYDEYGSEMSVGLSSAQHVAVGRSLNVVFDRWATTGGGDSYRSTPDNEDALLFALWMTHAGVLAHFQGSLLHPATLPTEFTLADAEVALPALADAYDTFVAWDSASSNPSGTYYGTEWGKYHFIERPTGASSTETFATAGMAYGAIRAGYSHPKHPAPPAVAGPEDLFPPISHGQSSMMIVELGSSAANSTVQYLKSTDHTAAWEHPMFSVEHTETWAAADPDNMSWAPLPLPSTLTDAAMQAATTTSLTYTP